MNSVVESIALVIGHSISWIILILAVITIVGFVSTVSKVKKLEYRMDDERRKKGGRKELTDGGIRKDPDVYTWEDNLNYLEDFNKICIGYSVFEQFVPIFPLLGILGTVTGLIEMGTSQDGMATAMLTTLYGLLAAIILKFVDAGVTSKAINKMELYFDTFEQNYQMAKDKYNQQNER